MLKIKTIKSYRGVSYNKWSNTAVFLAFLSRFPVRFEVPMYPDALAKMSEQISVISNQVDLKTTLSLENGTFFSIVRLKRALKSSEDLPE